ncbi:hypothetical protein ACN263_22205 [Micromonospora sp. WMMD729]|uniref:hypothetical protein n=1 Tax=Micromonospora sp. WMMD729 TaxID=3404127 RepID=UPI003BF4C953
MNGRRVVSGGMILLVGALGALVSAPVLLAGNPAVLPITILGVAAMALGAVQLRGGLRAPAPRRGPRRVPGPRRRHADTSVPLTYYGAGDWPGSGDPGSGDSGGGDSGGGFFGGDSGGGGFFGGDSGGGGFSGGGGDSGGGGGGS